jgi:hypothetical protein
MRDNHANDREKHRRARVWNTASGSHRAASAENVGRPTPHDLSTRGMVQTRKNRELLTKSVLPAASAAHAAEGLAWIYPLTHKAVAKWCERPFAGQAAQRTMRAMPVPHSSAAGKNGLRAPSTAGEDRHTKTVRPSEPSEYPAHSVCRWPAPAHDPPAGAPGRIHWAPPGRRDLPRRPLGDHW